MEPNGPLVVGVGARRGTPTSEILRLVDEALAAAGLPRHRIALLATLDTKTAEAALQAAARELGVPLVGHPAGALARIAVPHPAAAVRAAVGTPSVAEAAALAEAPGGELLVPKLTSALATVAVARRQPDSPEQRPQPGLAHEQKRDMTDRGVTAQYRADDGMTSRHMADHDTAPHDVPEQGMPDQVVPAQDVPAQGVPAQGVPAQNSTAEPDLRHHGDAEVRAPGLVDLAVNVRTGTPPGWLRERLAATLGELAAYPDQSAARSAVAARHGRPLDEVLLTSGAAEAFVLLARTLRPRQVTVVHPQFTEPEAALRDAGYAVHRTLLSPDTGFRLTPARGGAAGPRVPAEADLVVIGNPTNPTSILHPATDIAALARAGRTLVVDEAFMDTVPGEGESLAAVRHLPGRVVVLRSLTKTWGLAGLRIGYVLGPAGLIRELAAAQPLWPVSTPALAAAEACSTPEALAEAETAALTLLDHRAHLLAGLAAFPPVRVYGAPAASFVLVELPGAAGVRDRLRAAGFAVRRGDTFPGLGADWLRIAVRAPETTDRFLAALADAL